MPGGDRRGPRGMGPMTGRGLGPCRGVYGRSRRFAGWGGRGFGPGPCFGPPYWEGYYEDEAPESKKEFLERQKEFLTNELKALDKELEDL